MGRGCGISEQGRAGGVASAYQAWAGVWHQHIKHGQGCGISISSMGRGYGISISSTFLSQLSSVVDNKEELSSKEVGSKDSQKEPTKETKRVPAVNKRSKAKQPDTSGKIPEVTYPICLGYSNGSDPDDGVSHLCGPHTQGELRSLLIM